MSNLNSKALRPFRKRKETPNALGVGNGWCRQLDKAWENGFYAVMARDIETKWGKVTHLFITGKDHADIPWFDKQVIKNKLVGYDKLAIEVFPPQEKLVDEANAYHLWVLHDFEMPFGIHLLEDAYHV